MMRARWLLATAVLAVLTSCTGSRTRSPSGLEPIPVGAREAAPAPTGQTLAGADVTATAYSGKVLVVNFWASWCPPCIAETGELQQAYAKTASLRQSVAFLGIDIRDDRTSAQAFERNRHVSYPSVYDETGRLLLRFRALAPQTPPATFIYDRQGRLAWRHLGPITAAMLLAPLTKIARE